MSCISHIEHPKEHYYSLVIDPTVSTIFISEHCEKATEFLVKKQIITRICEKKSVCTKGGTKHLSNIYINTGKPGLL